MAAADLLVAARLLARLPGFLRRPVGLEEARAALPRRLAERERTFLDLVRHAVYARPGSPYARLLRHAGCEWGDLARLVRADGIEAALRSLLAAGVYLTVEELKGRRPVVRGALTLAVDPAGLRNPLARCDLPLRSGGSRGPGTPLGWDLAFVRDRAVNLVLAAGARRAGRRHAAVWAVPGSGALVHLLDVVARGDVPARWFSMVDPASPSLPRRYRWSGVLVRAAGRLAGVPLPQARHVPVTEPDPVVRWLAEALAAGALPYLHGRPSAVTRVAEAAHRVGLDLRGAEAAIGGEPITAARLRVMRASGMHVLPRYAAVELGLVGDACLAPEGPDDVHVLHDLVAVIQPAPGRGPGPFPADALLASSLRPTAPLVLLNASMGDRAAMGPARCGCALAALGWTTRLGAIQSAEKLTGEGMTFLDADVVQILETTLPGRFGGGPGHYQLVEQARAGGAPELRLLVDPAVGPVDPAAVRDAFLDAVGAASSAAWLMARVWRDAALVTIERRPPIATAGGKVLHLHREASAAPPDPGPGA